MCRVIYGTIARGVKRDLVQSWMWLSLAVSGGYVEAKEALTNVNSRLTPQELQEAQRLVQNFTLNRPPKSINSSMLQCDAEEVPGRNFHPQDQSQNFGESGLQSGNFAANFGTTTCVNQNGTGASSPYTLVPSSDQQYFRARVR